MKKIDTECNYLWYTKMSLRTTGKILKIGANNVLVEKTILFY